MSRYSILTSFIPIRATNRPPMWPRPFETSRPPSGNSSTRDFFIRVPYRSEISYATELLSLRHRWMACNTIATVLLNPVSQVRTPSSWEQTQVSVWVSKPLANSCSSRHLNHLTRSSQILQNCYGHGLHRTLSHLLSHPSSGPSTSHHTQMLGSSPAVLVPNLVILMLL